MRRIGIIIALGTAAIAAAVFGLERRIQPSSHNVPATQTMDAMVSVTVPQSGTLRSIDTDAFLDPIRARSSWMGMQTPPVPRGRVIAGVVNHHVLATDLLARFFHTLKVARPDATRFIIISPDHYSAGRSEISTHGRPYRVGSQLILIDTTSTRVFIDLHLAAEEDGTMYEREHGVGALVPFLAHEFPDAMIVPFSIRGVSDRTNDASFGRSLAHIVDAHTVIIISSDMSHYLDERMALRNDVSTLAWLTDLDAGHLSVANDDFLDNGASMVALFSLFDALDMKPTFHLLDHSISSAYGGPSNNTTSYINGLWTEDVMR
jgi:poly-gamma-glutamate synthesis protein (capsule biosynthesis protein)